MKRLIMVLIVALLLVAGSAFAATVNCIMYSSENDGWFDGGGGQAGPPITSDYSFTIETDGVTGEVVAFTDLFSNYMYAYSAGGYDSRDGAPFDAGEQIFPNGALQTVSQILFDGNTSGPTMWWRHQTHPNSDPFAGLVFNCGIIGVNFDGTDGAALFGPNEALAETYIFHAVPIPAAGWLLMTGLVGLLGFRKKFRKEVS